MKTGTCKKCHGKTKQGVALNNPVLEGSEGHGTLSQGKSNALISCMKCVDCGHSYLPKVRADWEVRLDELIIKLSV